MSDIKDKMRDMVNNSTILLTNKMRLRDLCDGSAFTEETVAEYNIGWCADAGKYTFPIMDRDAAVMDILYIDEDDIGSMSPDGLASFSKIHFNESIKAKHYGRNIAFNAVVVGKDLSPYMLPKQVHIGCTSSNRNDKKCYYCPVFLNAGEMEYNFSCVKDKEVILRFIGVSDKQVKTTIREYLKLPTANKCKGIDIKVQSRQSVEEILITSELDYERVDAEYIVQKAYAFADDVKTNQQFTMFANAWNDPNTQQSLHIVSSHKTSKDSIAKWQLDEKHKAHLKLFQPEDHTVKESVLKKIAHIYKDLSSNITKIKKREPVIMATDLVYHSALQFDFLGSRVTKGWMECLIGGDTRTGKTETVRNLVRHYKAGEFLTSGENITLAGILGGVQQTHGNRWSLTWGKLPLNDRGLCIVDEAEELTKKEIMGFLSGVRSSGVAEVVKIQARKTFARTRIIFIANPINGRVAEYDFGVNIVKELMGAQQDIARLDFAILCDKEDVSDSEINTRDTETVPHIYTSDACHSRILYAWTRTPDQIRFMEGSEDMILHAATELGKEYSPEVPLVIGAEMRIKLARMAVSIAQMTYSCDETGDITQVYPSHVLVAVDYLNNQYQSDTMGYKDFSRQRKMAHSIKDEQGILTNRCDTADRINMLLDCRRLQVQDLQDIYTTDQQSARQIMAVFRQCNAVQKVAYYYHKTPAFIKFLKEKRDEIQRGNDPSGFIFDDD